MATSKTKAHEFQQELGELQNEVEQLENGELSLDQALKHFESLI